MGPIRKPTIKKHSVNHLCVTKSPGNTVDLPDLFDDPDLKAILELDLSENKIVGHPGQMDSGVQLELDVEEDGTPLSVYMGCLVPLPSNVESTPSSPPLSLRTPGEIECYCKSQERFFKLLHKTKRRTRAATETLTRTKATRDVKMICAAMHEAEVNLEPFCLKRLFQQESDSE